MPVAIPLPDVLVEGERVSVPRRLAGFYERREREIGIFLTEEDWAQRPTSNVAHVLNRISGITVRGGWRVLVSSAPYHCRRQSLSATIYLDGAVINPETLQDINIDAVTAIEVYERFARYPTPDSVAWCCFGRNEGYFVGDDSSSLKATRPSTPPQDPPTLSDAPAHSSPTR